MDELVKHLSHGEHPVVVGVSEEDDLQQFRESIERQFVHIKFTDTRGGTVLGFRLESEQSDLESGDLNAGTGTVKLVGTLKLNYVPVRCIAEVDLTKLSGTGRLTVIGDESSTPETDAN